jgi:hypothetical protein
MKKFLLLTILLAVILPISSATKRALLIGISEYPSYNEAKDASWSSIHGANDVSLLKTTLKNKGFIISTLTNSQATASRIRKAFSKLQGEAKPGDIIYLHFSGHGQPFEDQNGDEEDGWDESIIPYDAQMVYKKGKYEGAYHITDDELHTYFQKIRSKIGPSGLLCVVIDACHAGNTYMGDEEDEEESFLRGIKKGFSPNGKSFHPRINTKGNFLVSKSKGQSDIIVLEACRSYQSNYEIKKNGKYYGPLSYCVNQVLTTQNLSASIGWILDVKKKMADEKLIRQDMVYETSIK